MEQAVGVGLQEGLDGRQTHAKLERRNTAPFGPGMLSSKAERLLANYMLNSNPLIRPRLPGVKAPPPRITLAAAGVKPRGQAITMAALYLTRT